MNEPDYKSLSRGISRDMSSEAIARRLKIVADLFELAKTLKRFKNLGRVEGAGECRATESEHDATLA
jgi:hypothetical protein